MSEKITVSELRLWRWECPECKNENEDEYTPIEDGNFCTKCEKRFYKEDFDQNVNQI